jgi:sugar lactone lactonase YvrE
MKITLGLSFILTATLITGCGGSSSNSSNSATNAEPEASVEPETGVEPETSVEPEEELKASQLVQLDFPLVNGFTHLNTVTVRGRMLQDVDALTINGQSAQLDPTKMQWQVDLPINAGSNALSVVVSKNEKNYTLENVPSISRGDIIADDIPNNSAFDSSESKLYFVDPGESIVWQLDVATQRSTPLMQIKEQVFGDLKVKKLDQGIALSADNSQLYISGIDDNNDGLILKINLSDSTVNVELSAKTASLLEDSSGIEYLTMAGAQGSQGQLLIARGKNNVAPLLYDVATSNLSELAITDLATITSNSNASVRGMALRTENDLLVWGTRSNKLYSFEVDLSSCDGMDSCTLGHSDYSTGYTLNGGSAGISEACNPDRIFDFTYHKSSHSFIGDFKNVCSLDIASTDTKIIYPTLLGNINNLLVVGDKAFYQSSSMDYGIYSIPMPSDYATASEPTATLVIAPPQFGDDSIQLTTSREVHYNVNQHQILWLDQGQEKVFSFDIVTQVWKELLHATELSSIDEAVFDPTSNRLYFIDSGTSGGLYSVNPQTGELATLIATPLADGSNPLKVYSIESIGLNEKEQQVYLAHRHNNSDVASDEGTMNIFAWDIVKSELKEVAPVTNNSDFRDYDIRYDLTYDDKNRSVYFYSGGSENEILRINIDSGERSLLSADNWVENSITTSNARGQTLDIANNRLLFSSQHDESVFAVNLDTGRRTHVSESLLSNGPLMWAPKGIDILPKQEIAFVSEERIESLFMVDLKTGQRLLIQR